MKSERSKQPGGSRSVVRTAVKLSASAAALLGTFAFVSSAHALTLGLGGGTGIIVPVLDAGITLPILPALPGGDAGVGTITIPLPGDAGVISLPIALPVAGTEGDAGAGEVLALPCSSDATCATGFYCNELVKLCLPALAVGASLVDGAHACVDAFSQTNPACASGSCNPTSNACVSTNGAVCAQALDCLVNICNSTGHCGAETGTATCTAATASTCETSTCSASGYCVPEVGGCYLDTDCSSAQYCDRSSFTCAPDIASGGALPTDGTHSTCAGKANACQSGACNPITDTCGAPVDSACTSGADCASNGCSPTTHTCTGSEDGAGSDGGSRGTDSSGGSGGSSGSGSSGASGTSGTISVTGSATVGATAGSGSSASSADAGTDAGNDDTNSDGNGVSCSVSHGTAGGALPFELVFGLVAIGALSRRRRTSR